ncbi:MAG: LptE family protein [Bacteroidales bacterium]|nr:LptE family protein [Bacteroidales bacterium]MDD4670579.1 LptE family protein [Bacteroidales bacterium]
MKPIRLITTAIALIITVFSISGCWFYSFSGTSIKPDVKTICIEPVENKALKINPSLANSLTEALNDKYRKLTNLEQVSDVGDLNVSAIIESYDVRPSAVTADEVAAQNRLTVTVKVKFVNEKHPEENFEKQFAGFEDYDSQRSLDEVEATLCDSIIEKIVEDIFNATVANW